MLDLARRGACRFDCVAEDLIEGRVDLFFADSPSRQCFAPDAEKALEPFECGLWC